MDARTVARATMTVALVTMLAPSELPGQELRVGDEIVYSGGPSAPPQSKATGLILTPKVVSVASEVASDEAASPAPGPLRARKLRGRSVDELLDLSRATRPDDRASALVTLASLPERRRTGEPALTLRGSLADEDVRVVALGARLLGQVRDRGAVGSLIRLLDCGRPELERAAVTSLGLIGDPAAAPHLERLAGLGEDVLSPLAEQALERLERP